MLWTSVVLCSLLLRRCGASAVRCGRCLCVAVFVRGGRNKNFRLFSVLRVIYILVYKKYKDTCGIEY